MDLFAGILAGAMSLDTYKEDVGIEFREAKRSQREAIVAALEPVARAQKIARPTEWAALVLTIGQSESGWSLRIGAGLCKPAECDRGRARGPFQLHRYAEAVPVWEQMHGLDNIDVQVRVASARLVRGYYTCRGGQDWFIATVNGFAGRKCSDVWTGLDSRYHLYKRTLRVIEREANRKKADS